MMLDLTFAARDQQTVMTWDQVTAPLAFRATVPVARLSTMLAGAMHGRIMARGGGLLAGQTVEMSMRVGSGSRV